MDDSEKLFLGHVYPKLYVADVIISFERNN